MQFLNSEISTSCLLKTNFFLCVSRGHFPWITSESFTSQNICCCCLSYVFLGRLCRYLMSLKSTLSEGKEHPGKVCF